MVNTKISQLTALTTPTGGEELVYAYNNTNGKMTLNTMKAFATDDAQEKLVSGVNIKTINGNNILGSGNIDVSGGGGGGEPTELSGDANIWELSEGDYITTHDLYYRTGMKLIPQGYQDDWKIYIRVIVDESANNNRGFFAFSVDDSGNHGAPAAWFGSSTSSSWGYAYVLKDCTYMVASSMYTGTVPVSGGAITVGNILGGTVSAALSGNYELNCYANNPYIGMEHLVYIPTQTSTYSITANGIDNPFNITLPTNTTKACLLKVYVTGVSSAIISDCKIAS